MGESSPYIDSRSGPITPIHSKVSMAPHPFLYTPDQIAQMLVVPVKTVTRSWLYYEGRSTGRNNPSKMRAINVAPNDEPPVWRIEEAEVVRWMRARRIRIYKYQSPLDDDGEL